MARFRSQRLQFLAAPTLGRGDEAVTHEGPVDRRASRERGDSFGPQDIADRARSPLWVRQAQLDDPRLDGGGHLVGTVLRLGALVDEGGEPPIGALAQPGVHRLAAHPIALGDLGDARPVEHFEDRLGPLFRNPELHEHHGLLRDRRRRRRQRRRWRRRAGGNSGRGRCHPCTGATVAQLPGPRRRVSSSYRSHVVQHEPGPHTVVPLVSRDGRAMDAGGCGKEAQENSA